jgi:hypothetical protein
VRRRSKFVLLLGLVAAAVAVAVVPAASSAGSAKAPAGQPQGPVILRPAGTLAPQAAGDLTYGGGPVMRTNTYYAIFWQPTGYAHPFPSGYQSTIEQYFTDVAHDSGGTDNVYGISTQYFDNTGPIAYNATFAGSVLDTHPYPANGCTDSWPTTLCLSDTQLRTEITNEITANGWPKNTSTMYFIFTPQDVGSCLPGSLGGGCAYTDYCAYHFDFTSGGSPVIYANQPFTKGYDCDSIHQYPNGSASGADLTINVVSHEHMEAITDPEPWSGWNAPGGEIGDLCAWTYGSLSGPNGAEYNETINGHHYLLQEEYDNSTHACKQRPAGAVPPTVSSLKPSALGQGAPKAKVTIFGANFVNGATVSVSGSGVTVKSVTFVGSSTLDVTIAVASGAATGNRDVTVTNPGNATGTCTGCLKIDLGPTVTQVVPPAGARGATSLPVQILGSNFAKGAKVKFGKGIKVNSHTFVNANEIDAVITISPTAKTGGYTVTVTNKDKGVGTLANGFTVT